MHFSGLLLWMKEKKPDFPGCEFVPVADEPFSFARAAIGSEVVLATAWNARVPVGDVTTELRGEEMIGLCMAGEGADDM